MKNIIFDWDGTLGMTLHLWLDGYRAALEGQGHSLHDDIIAQNFFYGHEEVALKYPEVDFLKLRIDARAHTHDNLDDLALYESAAETVTALHDAGINVSLVSSSPRLLLDRGLASHDFTKIFTSVVAGDEVKNRKPDPEPFHKTLQNIQGHAEETIIVGDAEVDILAGKAAGVKTCLFTPEVNGLFHDFDDLHTHEPDHSISHMSDLLQVISS